MSAVVQQKNPGWLKGLVGRYQTIADKEIALGFPKGKQQAYPDGTSVVEVAAQNVFGTDTIPQRDFITYAQDGIKHSTEPILGEIAKRLNDLKEEETVSKLMEAAGMTGASAIQDAILEGDYAPNSSRPMGHELRAKVVKSWNVNIPEGMSYKEAKKKFRGSSKPLIDTSHMKNAVTYAVRDKTQ